MSSAQTLDADIANVAVGCARMSRSQLGQAWQVRARAMVPPFYATAGPTGSLSAAQRTGVSDSPCQDASQTLALYFPADIKVEDGGVAVAVATASADRDRPSSHGWRQRIAAAEAGTSSALNAPQTPGGAQQDKATGGAKRSLSKALAIREQSPSGSKRLKASSSSERKASATGVPCAEAPWRPQPTGGKAVSLSQHKAPKAAKVAAEVDHVHGDARLLTSPPV